MAENSRIQIIFKQSKPIIKILASVAIVLSIVALIALHMVQTDIQNETDVMRAEAARLQQENANLQDKIDGLGSVQSAQEIAEEELELVDPDTILFETD